MTVHDENNQEVVGLSNRDIRLAWTGSGLTWCDDGFYPLPIHAPNCADAATNIDGQALFTRAYHGGGHEFGGLQVWIQESAGSWAPIADVIHQVSVVSCNISGDLTINISDIAIFTQAIGRNCP